MIAIKDATSAEIHASKTQHFNFSESTEKIQPKTPLPPELKIKMAPKKERWAREQKKKRKRRLSGLKIKKIHNGILLNK